MYPSDSKLTNFMPKRRPNYDTAQYRAALEAQMREHEYKKKSAYVPEKIGGRPVANYGNPQGQPVQHQQQIQVVANDPRIGIIPGMVARTSPVRQAYDPYTNNNNYNHVIMAAQPYVQPQQPPPPPPPPPQFVQPLEPQYLAGHNNNNYPVPSDHPLSPHQPHHHSETPVPHPPPPPQVIQYVQAIPPVATSPVLGAQLSPSNNQRPTTTDYEVDRAALPKFGRRSSTRHANTKEEAARAHKEELLKQIEEQKRQKMDERNRNKRVVDIDAWAPNNPHSGTLEKIRGKQSQKNEYQEILQRQIEEKQREKEQLKQRQRMEEIELEKKIKEELEKQTKITKQEEARRKVDVDQPASIVGPAPLKKVYHHQKYRMEQEQKAQAFRESMEKPSPAHSPKQSVPFASPIPRRSPSPTLQDPPMPVLSDEPKLPSAPPMFYVRNSLETAASRNAGVALNGYNNQQLAPVPPPPQAQLRELDAQFDSLLKGISSHQEMLSAINAKFAMDVAQKRYVERSTANPLDSLQFKQNRDIQARELQQSDAQISNVLDTNKRRMDALSGLNTKDDVGYYLDKFVRNGVGASGGTRSVGQSMDLGATLTAETAFVPFGK